MHAADNGLYGAVESLVVRNGELFACGWVGVTPTARGAAGRWNGTLWTVIDSSSSAFIFGATAYGGDIVAAGLITVPNMRRTESIARWDGTRMVRPGHWPELCPVRHDGPE